MPYTPSEQITGINPNTNFLLQLDTQQRMNRVFEDVKEPMQYKIPQFSTPYDPKVGFHQDDIMNVGNTDTILNKALDSPDPEVRKRAYDAIGKESAAISAGVGQTQFTPYYNWQDKYINDKFGYNPNFTQQQNEQYYYKDYLQKGSLDKIFSNTAKFFGRVIPQAVLKLGEGFGYMGAMAWGGLEQFADLYTGEDNHDFMKTVSENSFSRKLMHYEEELKNSKYLSVYKPQDWDSRTFLSRLGDAAMWNDEFADGMAFLLSAAVPGVAIGKLGSGVSLLGSGGKLASAMRWVGVETLGDVGSVVYNTVSESAFEAAEGFKTFKQRLIDERTQGKNHLTNKEIDERAGEVASARFKANLGILSVSNLFENKFFFKPIANRLSGITAPTGTKVAAEAIMKNNLELVETQKAKGLFNKFMGKMKGVAVNVNARVPFYASRFLKASFMEGMWEENAQLAAERWAAQGSYQNTEGDKIHAEKEFFKQYLKQTGEMFRGRDREAEVSVGLGAMIGIFGTSIIGKAFSGQDMNGNFQFWKGERRTRIDNAKKSIVAYNEAYHNMLSVDDIFKEDGKTIDDEKIKLKVEALRNYGFKQVTANDIKDETFRAKLQKDLFAEYIAAAVRADVHEALITRLDTLPGMSKEKLKNLGFNPEGVFNDPTAFAQRGHHLIDVYKEIQEGRTAKPKGMDFKMYEKLEDARKYQAYLAYSRALSSEDARDEYKGKMDEEEVKLKNKFAPLNPNYPIHLSEVNRFNALAREQEAIKTAIEEFDFFDNSLVKKNLKERLSDIKAEKASIFKNLDTLEKGRVEEITKDGNSILFDTKLDNKTGRANDEVAIKFGNKYAQVSVDTAINKALHEALLHPTDGIKNYELYTLYMSKRKVVQEEADATPNEDLNQAEEEVVQTAKDDIEEVISQSEEPVQEEDPMFAELNAINDRLNDLSEEKKALAAAPPVEEVVPVEEGEEPYAEVDGVKYFYPDLPDASKMDKLKFNHIMNLFTYYVEQRAAKEIEKENAEQEAIEKQAELENQPIIQSDEENFTNTLTDNYETRLMAYWTPFKTANREAEDESKEVEILNPESYTQMLSLSINRPMDTDRYEAILVKDREEWLNRFPKAQAKDIMDNNKLGMVLVFREKATGKFLTVGEHIPSKYERFENHVIVHSIENPNTNVGFQDAIEFRAFIKSTKTKQDVGDIMREYDDTNNLIRSIRERIISGELLEQSVEIEYGGDGIVPTTVKSATVNDRFNGYTPTFDVVTSANIEQFPGASEGELVASFPDHTSSNSVAKFIRVFSPPISTLDREGLSPEEFQLAKTIIKSVNDLVNGNITYDTYQEALSIIHSFLDKVIYTNNKFYFKAKKEGEKYVIQYVKLQDDKENQVRSMGSTRFNVNNKIFLGQENLQIPLRDGSFEQVSTALYRSLVSKSMRTYRKVVKTNRDKLHLDPVNAYYNLSPIERATEVTITETPVEPPIPTPKEETPLEKAIRKTKEELATEKPEELGDTYVLGKISIDLKEGLVTYSGNKKPSVIKETITQFLQMAETLQESNSDVVFGERDVVIDKVPSKIYFFGSKKSGTFVIFNDKLNQIKNINKFVDENKDVYEDIKNQCK